MINMTKKYYFLSIAVLLAVAAMSFMVFKYFPRGQAEILPTPQARKFSDNEGVDSVMQKIITEDETTKQAVPADNERFSVNYYGDAKNFNVIIKVKPYDEVKAEAVDWFKAQGFNEADFCSLNVTFLAVRGVKDKFEPKDAVFDGCPVPSAPVKVSPPPGQKLAPIEPSK